MASPIIKVRYLGATNHRGSRFVASAFDGKATVRATVNYDYGDVDNELAAAKKLAAKMTADNAYSTVNVCQSAVFFSRPHRNAAVYDDGRFYDDKATYFGTVYTNKVEA